jgi:sec-independent protein translocase protein TatB
MFDIGFTELIIVAIVGLLVIGPERLPDAICTGSKWLAQLKAGFNRIKADVESELGAEELQSQFRNDSITQSFQKDKEQLEALDQQARSKNIEFLDSLVKSDEPPATPSK